MSHALYDHGGLRFWSEEEIEFRQYATTRLFKTIQKTLLDVNNAWYFSRVEGPCLTPRDYISSSYTDEDVFVTNHKNFCLRAETTPSSYIWAKHLISTASKKLPLCVWQLGKSFRRENTDGATAAKMRYNEFYQLEFQCIYNVSTKADYRSYLIDAVSSTIKELINREIRIIKSDRLPSYSESTLDIEAFDNNQYREVASCSIRTDFDQNTRVAEIAIGIDRLTTMWTDNKL